MRQLTSLPAGAWSEKTHVLFDLDDTVTTNGQLLASTYKAIEDLQAGGLVTIPVTGRPAGWCDLVARFWPADAVVGENGAFYFRYDPAMRKMVRRYAMSDLDRRRWRRALDELAGRILQSVPGAAIAADQAYRELDLAIDYCEDVARLPPDQVAAIVALFESAGATAKVSSIHVNGWYGSHDKLTTTLRLLEEVYGLDAEAARRSCVFVGDSPNDAPMFGFFSDAVGVANIAAFAETCSALPRWIAAGESGAGFEECAAALLTAKRYP